MDISKIQKSKNKFDEKKSDQSYIQETIDSIRSKFTNEADVITEYINNAIDSLDYTKAIIPDSKYGFEFNIELSSNYTYADIRKRCDIFFHTTSFIYEITRNMVIQRYNFDKITISCNDEELGTYTVPVKSVSITADEYDKLMSFVSRDKQIICKSNGINTRNIDWNTFINSPLSKYTTGYTIIDNNIKIKERFDQGKTNITISYYQEGCIEGELKLIQKEVADVINSSDIEEDFPDQVRDEVLVLLKNIDIDSKLEDILCNTYEHKSVSNTITFIFSLDYDLDLSKLTCDLVSRNPYVDIVSKRVEVNMSLFYADHNKQLLCALQPNTTMSIKLSDLFWKYNDLGQIVYNLSAFLYTFFEDESYMQNVADILKSKINDSGLKIKDTIVSDEDVTIIVYSPV